MSSLFATICMHWTVCRILMYRQIFAQRSRVNSTDFVQRLRAIFRAASRTSSGEARGFKVGVREGTGEGKPRPAGGLEAVPLAKCSNCRCTKVSFCAFFRQKSTH
jgi:hypothetical protein